MTPYQPPAEWSVHDAVWLAWPSHRELWEDGLEAVQAEFVSLCRAIADAGGGETLRILVLDESGARAVRAALGDFRIDVQIAPFGDIWLRDTGPIFASDERGRRVAHRFRFNGWGERYRLPGDENVAPFVARASNAAALEQSLVLEGGAVEFDGEGTLLTTRSCLLNPNRNPGLSPSEVEAQLIAAFGVDRVIWLGEGLLNDHTDGHIDTLARFVAPGRVVCMAPSGDDDPNADVLHQLRTDLEAAVDARGRRLHVCTIPSPGRVVGSTGMILPASFVNFYIANTTVVVPTYGTAYDEAAVAGLAALFTDRRVIGSSARQLLQGGGAFHCITQQQPAGASDV